MTNSATTLHGFGWPNKGISAKRALTRANAKPQEVCKAQPHHSHGPGVLSPARGCACPWLVSPELLGAGAGGMEHPHGHLLLSPTADGASLPRGCSRRPLTSAAAHSHHGLTPGFRPRLHPCLDGERSISCNLLGVLLTDGPSSLAALTNT